MYPKKSLARIIPSGLLPYTKCQDDRKIHYEFSNGSKYINRYFFGLDLLPCMYFNNSNWGIGWESRYSKVIKTFVVKIGQKCHTLYMQTMLERWWNDAWQIVKNNNSNPMCRIVAIYLCTILNYLKISMKYKQASQMINSLFRTILERCWNDDETMLTKLSRNTWYIHFFSICPASFNHCIQHHLKYTQ